MHCISGRYGAVLDMSNATPGPGCATPGIDPNLQDEYWCKKQQVHLNWWGFKVVLKHHKQQRTVEQCLEVFAFCSQKC